MLSLIAFFVVLSILVLVHEFGHFITAKRLGVRVEKFSLGFGPKLLSIKRGDTEYMISAIPLGGYVKMAGDEPWEKLSGQKWELLSRSVGDRFKIIFAGPLLNYFLAFVIFSVIYMFGSPTMTTEVGGLIKDFPASQQGMLIGDKVIAIDGKPVKYWEDMTGTIFKHTEGAMIVTIERAGKTFDMSITPKVRTTKDIFGNVVKIAQIGVVPSQKIESVKYGFFESIHMGGKKLLNLTTTTYKALWSIATGRLSMKDSLTGLYNYQYFMICLNAEIKRVERLFRFRCLDLFYREPGVDQHIISDLRACDERHIGLLPQASGRDYGVISVQLNYLHWYR